MRHARRLSKGIWLLLGVALGVGWVRSFFVSDELQYAWSDPAAKSIGSCAASVSRGWLLVEWHRVDAEDPSGIVVLPKWSGWKRDKVAPDRLELPDARGSGETGRFLGIGWFAQRKSSARPTTDIDEQGPVTRPVRGGRMVAVEVWAQRAVLLPLPYLILPLMSFLAISLARRVRSRRKRAPPPARESTALAVRKGVA